MTCKFYFQVRCNAAENVELALQEFWTLSCLQKHLNIIRFEECYLQHAGKMRSMQHGDHSSPSYLCLVEMSIKGKDPPILCFVIYLLN